MARTADLDSKNFESKMALSRIPALKAMKTITTRPLLNLKLATLAVLTLLLLIQSL
jgi:hypothetical protein